ncbi:Photosystem II reaction center Psb28 protein [[Leptolyngbya] sp. PCC 7376]|uniref:photosystem II reaction center protein Psb28 n=1 Tax=[Leptolyngbya] sp. PCC 7376 TaxID=111781 RepID=UPI00029F4C8F|nr:photosystem II reaction center protein Psb28 [[Leptolyngbya] sp. PCC 7376]AFY39528.1 Photosystem II reaction center Psb28 protein [[Leptolyngbya] sp. PCC 7376]
MAVIQFSQGIDEPEIPDIRVTRAQDGSTGTAVFTFEDPAALAQDSTDEITGMYLIDEEGEIITREVKGKFYDGKARVIEARLIMRSPEEWERFLRFMERYGKQNGLEFTKS